MKQYDICLNNAQFGTYFDNEGVLKHTVIKARQVSRYHKIATVELSEHDILVLEEMCHLNLKVLVEKVKQYENN